MFDNREKERDGRRGRQRNTNRHSIYKYLNKYIIDFCSCITCIFYPIVHILLAVGSSNPKTVNFFNWKNLDPDETFISLSKVIFVKGSTMMDVVSD